jgi:hypothetical protein
MRPPVRLLVPAVAVAATLLLAGCGDDATLTSGDAASTDLTFRLDADGSGGATAQEVTLTCPGGDTKACAAIDALPADPTAETPPTQACTEVYGGPDTLTINGTLRGEDVSAAFSRGNGCDIERFERFADVLAALYPEYQPGSSIDVN